MYQIIFDGNPVGSAEIRKEGMFYRITCRYHLPYKSVFRVLLNSSNHKFDLGVCVPDGNGFSCVTRIACNQLKGDNFSFSLNDGAKKGGIPVAAGKPFVQLEKLNTARLCITNGQPELMIDPIQGQQDSDQIP